MMRLFKSWYLYELRNYPTVKFVSMRAFLGENWRQTVLVLKRVQKISRNSLKSRETVENASVGLLLEKGHSNSAKLYVLHA